MAHSLIIGSLGLALAVAAAGHAEPAAPGGDWKLVWSDEFSTDGRPDPAKWGYEVGFVRNDEAQWYQPENARCEAGLLIIEGRRERKPNPNYRQDSDDWRSSREAAEYTSASLTTSGKSAWTYGRFEMRARIDTRPGLWPAFRTVGARGRWPHGGSQGSSSSSSALPCKPVELREGLGLVGPGRLLLPRQERGLVHLAMLPAEPRGACHAVPDDTDPGEALLQELLGLHSGSSALAR